MPYARRRYRRPARRRRFVRRYGRRRFARRRRPRVQRNLRRPTLSIKQQILSTFTVPNTPSTFHGEAASFKLSDLTNYAAYTALFDQYRINAVHMKISPITNTATDVNPSLTVYWYIDNDDSVIPLNAQDMRDRGNVKSKILYGNQPRSLNLTMRPVPNRALFAGAVAPSGYGPIYKRIWIDTRSAGVEHYGLKLGFSTENAPLAQTMQFNILSTYYVSFKGLQ